MASESDAADAQMTDVNPSRVTSSCISIVISRAKYGR